MGDALMLLMDAVVNPILAATCGYRNQLIDMGFSDAISDEMAQEFNSVLLDRVRKIIDNTP